MTATGAIAGLAGDGAGPDAASDTKSPLFFSEGAPADGLAMALAFSALMAEPLSDGFRPEFTRLGAGRCDSPTLQAVTFRG